MRGFGVAGRAGMPSAAGVSSAPLNAVSFNPENRSLARQDPEFDALRDEPAFKGALETPAAEGMPARPATPKPRTKSRR